MKKIRLASCLLFTSLSIPVIADVSFELEGIDNQQASDNIMVFLKGLSIPEDADNERYLTEVTELSKDSLMALGYYQAKIAASVTNDESDQLVIIQVDLGDRVLIVDIDLKLTGEALDDANFKNLLLNLPLKKGQFLNHGVYESTKNRFKTLAQRFGYFDAKYSKSSVEVSKNNNTAIIHLWFDSGIRYQFGDLIFDSDTPAKKFVNSLRNFKLGEPFDTNMLNIFNQDLNETGYFKGITILPEFENKQGRQIPLRVIYYMRPEDSFNAGIGYSTDEGIRGKFRWLRPWINTKGHSIESNFIASLEKQEASITYKIPIEDPLYNYFAIHSAYKMLDQNDTNTKQYIASFNRHRRLSNEWLRTIYIRYDKESGIQGTQKFSTELILPGISFDKTRSRGGINIEWGEKHLVYFELANKNVFSSNSVIKFYGQSKLIRTFDGHQFVASAEAGAIFADSIYDVPSSMRFFTGGDQSIRGYGYEEVAPTDSSDELVGGSFLATGSLEYRFPLSKAWKLAVFSDSGVATDDFSEPISMSAGSGIVWGSPVGPIRLYVAFPFTETEDDFKIHFMVGPEL